MSHLRAAIYLRPRPTTPGRAEDQRIELKEIATARSWTVVATFSDQANPTTGGPNSPGLDALIQAAARREIEIVAISSLDQLGRTTRHLIHVVNVLHEHGIDLYSHQDGIDTTAASGKSVLTAFASLAAFERTMIRERARISLDKARRNGTRLGRPTNVNASVNAAIVALRGRGFSIRRIATELRVGNRSVYAALEAARTARAPETPRNPDNGFGTRLRTLGRVGQEVPA